MQQVQNQAPPMSSKTMIGMFLVLIIMMVVIIVMGVTLPAGMGIYWLAGALIMIAQTLITNAIMRKREQKQIEKKKGKKY